MPGLTDRDLRRIERSVRTPPNRRTPRLLLPTAGEGTDGSPTPEEDGHGPEAGYGDGEGWDERWDETGG